MGRRMIISMLVAFLCLAVPRAYAQRGRGEGRSGGGHSPGGEWSERSHQGGNHAQGGGANRERTGGNSGGKEQGFAGKNGASVNGRGNNSSAAAGAAAAERRGPQATGAQGAAAGAAAANRNNPTATGKQGAAAGAAAANRNSPQYSGAQGAAAGAAVANRNSPQFSGAEGATAGAAAVRNSFNNPSLYNSQWYGAHAGAWYPHGWTAGAVWGTPTWGAVGGYYGAGAAPVAYNYGVNPAYSNGMVTMNGQPVGTPAEYSQQAAELAATGAGAEAASGEDWMPLGVFAMVRNEQQHPQLILQLAVNKQGILRGNYTDEVTEHTQPIQGAADPKTQRAAWTVGDNTESVMEAGMSDLAQGEAPALIHKNGKTDHWLLVRLDKPEGQTADSPAK